MDNSSGNLYKLCGYGNPSTKSYAASFKEQKNKTLVAVAGGKVQLAEGGVAYLKRRDELPLAPTSNEDAIRHQRSLEEEARVDANWIRNPWCASSR
ncbi:hypothetical protein IV203_008298 [Nitzschia inconspicua]|uniref:Uncharacterized protein n=1 Tax=Nitzschia inconspicua TaxID=303405 RepID=A0A9K3KY90_9STRA|nr:hypothetical protein IV203_008298 [Nitzschia inconspicua]